MDKSGNIKKHSKEKLLVYKKYLIEYLSVLTNQSYYDRIFIWDIFAGRGQDKQGVRGSALIAAQVIKDFREPKKNYIQLVLNELDEENYNRLKDLIDEKEFQEFTKVYKEKADDFLQKVSQKLKKAEKIHSLFFIDPHGYTQCSTDKLKRLFNLSNAEYLMFIPTNHIYRFIHPRKGDAAASYKSTKEEPAVRFVLDLGVEEDSLKDIKTPNDFVAILKNALKKFADTKYVYSYKVQNKEKSGSFYHLFFITKHIKGAEKFLEAKEKVKSELKNQLSLFNEKELNLEDLLKPFLKKEKTNKEVFIFGIKEGFLKKEINPVLRKWEESECLEINAEFKRRKGAFYLSDKPEKLFYLKIKT